MRCLNCTTVLMDNDLRCPSCGMATPLGAANAPAAPISPFKKWSLVLIGLPGGLFLLVGGAFLGFGVAFGWVEEPKPVETRTISADELLEVHDPAKLKDPWVIYHAPVVVESGVMLERRRIGASSGQVQERYVLARVKDRWMVCQVPPNWSGHKLEGKLIEWNNSILSQKIMVELQRRHPDKFQKLTFASFDALEKRPVTTAGNMLVGAVVMVVIGLILLGLGFGALKSKTTWSS